MLKGVSFAKDGLDCHKVYQVKTAIESLRAYFYKFNRDADEAMDLAFHHALEHFNPDKGELHHYIKSLARDITKTEGKEIPTDFLDQRYSDSIEEDGRRKNSETELSDRVEKQIELESMTDTMVSDAVHDYALGNMVQFMQLCSALINRDTSTKPYTTAFKNETKRLTEKIPDFLSLCLRLYTEYKDQFLEFLGMPEPSSVWRELDAAYIAKSTSRRVRLVSPTDPNNFRINPDEEDWVVRGALSGKRIVKVPYASLRDYMVELIDSDVTNPVKFCLGDSYIFRSLGGSLSSVNANLFRQYDIFVSELLTNVLWDFNARFLCKGSESLYILASGFTLNPNGSIKTRSRTIRGIEINYTAYDVTPQ